MQGDITEELVVYLNKYYEVFGDNYPTLGNPVSTVDEAIEDIKECIAKNKTFGEMHPEVLKDYETELVD